MKLNNNMLIVVVLVVAVGVAVYLNQKEDFDSRLDKIPWDKICKKEYCDLPNYYSEIYPNKKGYKNNRVYTINGKCCLLSNAMLKCLSHRGSSKYCKDVFP